MSKMLRFAAMALALGLLAGCVYAPPPPQYGYGYGYAPGYAPGYAYAPAPYYAGPPVAIGLGFGFGGGWHHHDWR